VSRRPRLSSGRRLQPAADRLQVAEEIRLDRPRTPVPCGPVPLEDDSRQFLARRFATDLPAQAPGRPHVAPNRLPTMTRRPGYCPLALTTTGSAPLPVRVMRKMARVAPRGSVMLVVIFRYTWVMLMVFDRRDACGARSLRERCAGLGSFRCSSTSFLSSTPERSSEPRGERAPHPHRPDLRWGTLPRWSPSQRAAPHSSAHESAGDGAPFVLTEPTCPATRSETEARGPQARGSGLRPGAERAKNWKNPGQTERAQRPRAVGPSPWSPRTPTPRALGPSSRSSKTP
jgi:hypothetical protein